eukprot:117002-Hanusia_phi.AAC.1
MSKPAPSWLKGFAGKRKEGAKSDASAEVKVRCPARSGHGVELQLAETQGRARGGGRQSLAEATRVLLSETGWLLRGGGSARVMQGADEPRPREDEAIEGEDERRSRQ